MKCGRQTQQNSGFLQIEDNLNKNQIEPETYKDATMVVVLLWVT
jgi:hypothetical protein